MSLKESNEITVKIKEKLDEFYKIIEEKWFKFCVVFSMNDTYFIPQNLKLDKMTTREILSKAILVREIEDKTFGKMIKKITFKIKNFDENGSILNQESINCDVLDIEDAKNLLWAFGYQDIMTNRGWNRGKWRIKYDR